ncbi:hypothetical protein JGU66_23990 [Myxococcaceae bacterium JPH2]|nr:hypothetical protein [Myxococcaceae bacterium JPH2]
MDVGIVGLSGRFPQAHEHHTFWQGLLRNHNFVEPVPAERWSHAHFVGDAASKAFVAHQSRCRHGSFVPDYDCFDAGFFDVDPDGLAMLDPQARIAMEVAWSCIEDAGYRPSQLGHDVGVFAGLTYADYQKLIPQSTHLYALASRLAYFFDFRGINTTVDAGCCSSLMAIHLACQALRSGECRRALVIGANLLMHPDHYSTSSSMMSPSEEPRSRPYGADNGWIPAEGVVALMLRPLDSARDDADHVYGIIKSSHVAQEGRTSWFTAPSAARQAQFLIESFDRAKIDPATISCAETAANGSLLGDAIEFDGMSRAFQHSTDATGFCAISSVKSNVGHGESVSTLLQLSKVLLQFETRTLLPTQVSGERNPNIEFEPSPFFFLAEPRPWKPQLSILGSTVDIPLRASITSSGTGGMLGHLILEAPEDAPPTVHRAFAKYLILLSSSTPEQLRETIQTYLWFFKESGVRQRAGAQRYSPLNIMYTLIVGRQAFPARAGFVVETLDDLIRLFDHFLAGEQNPSILTASDVAVDGPTASECIRKRAWHELGRLWVQGQDFDAEAMFEGLPVRRLSLPTYRFRRTRFPLPRPRHPHEDTAPSAERVLAPAPESTARATPPPARGDVPATTARALLLQLVAERRGTAVESSDLQRGYSELGLTSLELVAVVKGLEARTGLRILPSVLFDHRTLAELADHLEAKHPGRFTVRPSADPIPSPPKAPAQEQGEADPLSRFKQGRMTLEELEALLDEQGA